MAVIHKNITGDEAIHEIMYVQSSDPGAVGANKFWLDTTGGATLDAGAILKQRNGANSGWTTRADLATALGLKLAKASNLSDLASASTARTNLSVYSKAESDALIAGLSWKQAVRAATTANGTLSTAFANGQTIDGVTLATGDRILIKNQSTGSENGIYIVAASGAPTRATDADSGAELVNASCYVSEGTTNADTQWTCTTNATITVGSTSLAFAQLATGGSTTLAGLTDVAVTSPADTEVLTYEASSSKWKNKPAAGGGSAELFDDVAKSSNYTIVSGDKGKTFLCSAELTLTLPSAANKFWFGAYNASSASFVTVGSLIRLAPGEYVRVASDGTSFFLIESKLIVPLDSPFRWPVTGNAADDEFIGSSLDTSGTRTSGATAWAWNNQGSTTLTVGNRRAVATTSGISSAIQQTLPSAPYRYRVFVSLQSSGTGSNAGSGLALLDSVGGKAIKAGLIFKPSVSLVSVFTDLYTNWTTFSSNGVVPFAHSPCRFSGWLEIENDNTSLIWRASPTGEENSFTEFDRAGKTAWMASGPDKIAVEFGASSGSTPQVAAFRRVA